MFFFRCLQQVHLDKHIKLLDCPGIVMATSTTDATMILRNCVKIEQLVDPLPPVEAILRRCNKAQVCRHFSECCLIVSFEHRHYSHLSERTDHGALRGVRLSHRSGVLGNACSTSRKTEEGRIARLGQSCKECANGLDMVRPHCDFWMF